MEGVFNLGKNQKAPKKKNAFVKTTSKKTGAIILISTIIFIVLVAGFFFYAYDFAEKQKQLENTWRLQDCDDMLSNYSLDPWIWKAIALKDKNCITYDEFENLMAHFTK